MAFKVNPYDSYTNRYFNNPYSFKQGRVNQDVSGLLYQISERNRQEEEALNKKRSGLDRTLDTLMTPVYMSAGFVDGMIDGSGEDSRTALQGMIDGLKAGNPFGDGYTQGETTYSDVLHTAGWQPESTAGKIAKGVVGFGLDVLLDPTTYLTGGASAIVKGTGRVGKGAEALGKATEEVARVTRANQRVAELVGKGVDPNLAQRVAEKGLNKPLGDIASATHMTEDMAKEIITYQMRKKGVTKSADELTQDATKLADEYNRVIGIRDAKGAGDVTWGIGNLPFMPRKHQDKVIRLGSAEPLRKMSDTLRISNAYAGLRNHIYGRQIGRMFSTTSAMYKLAHDNPAKLWEGLEYVAHTRGMKMDKLQEERKIREYFESLKLTEAENKEIIKLLQDKTIWNKIAQKAKFKDLEVAKTVRKLMNTRTASAQKELDELLQKRQVAEHWKGAIDEKLVSEKELYEMMKKTFQDDLVKMDISHVNDKGKLESLIKMYSNEINEIGKVSDDIGDVGALNKLHESAKAERGMTDEVMSEGLETPTLKNQNRADKESNAMDGVIRKANKVSGNSKSELKRALSSYLYGHDKAFKIVGDEHIDDLMKQINDGAPKNAIRAYVEKNPNLFDSRMREANKAVAETMGYTRWHEDGFKYPLARILGKRPENVEKIQTEELREQAFLLLKQGKLNDRQTALFTELIQKELKRKVLQRQLSEMSMPEIKAYRTKIANEKLLEDFNVSDEGFLDLSRAKWREDQSALVDEKVGKDYRYSKNRNSNPNKAGEYDILRNLTSGDRPLVMDDIINSGIFKREVVENADGTFLNYLNRIVDTVDNLAVEKFGRSYLELTQKQKTFALRLATNSVAKGNYKIDSSLIKSAEAEAKKRLQREADELKQAHKELEHMTPEEIFENSSLAQTERAIKEGLSKELHKTKEQLSKLNETYVKSREDAINFYDKRIAEQKGEIIKLEARQQDYVKMLREANDESIVKLADEIGQYEKVLSSDDALESWVRLHNQSDIALLKDPERYARLTRTDDLPENWLGATGENGVEIAKNIDKRVFFDALKKRAEKIYGDKYSYDELKSLVNTPEKMERFVMEHELSHFKNKDWLKRDRDKGNLNDPRTAEIERRADFDAIDMLKPIDVDKLLREAQPVDAGKIWLDNVASSEKVANTVRILRDRFVQMGAKEAEIGKLGEEQFASRLMDYLPHIPTEDGKAFFRARKEVGEHGSKVTHDLGYGLKYSPHSKARTIKGKTVEEINEYFKNEFPELLKGKNIFSENVADIYFARAMTHTELMYDNKYMHTMMNVFGKDIPADGVIEKGYKAVMNYGMMRETTHDIASMRLSSQISHEVSEFLSSNFTQFKSMANDTGMDLDKFINAQIDNYLKSNYPDDKIKEIFDGFHKMALKKSELPKGSLGDEAMPMVELNGKQIKGIRTEWDDAYDEYLQTLNRSQMRALERGDNTRLRELEKRFEKLAKRTPPQIKQVNDAIVMKANQARKLQRAKDQNRFLQLYDKFLHFMKLNQTVVAPSFHMRNKASNIFLNWLGTGRDAVNKDWQIASTILAKNEGDASKIKEIIENGKFGSKQLGRPVDIPNPHPSLQQALNLNNGQLHWTDVYELAVRYDVIDSGQFARDIGAGASSQGLFKGLHRTKKDGSTISLDPTDTANFALYKAGTKVGSTVENGDRLIHFVSQLRQGKSIEEATRSSKQFLFDYSDLTAFEIHTMKRIFPYYTWLRKNARLQVSQVLEQPGKYRDVAKVMTGVEHMTPEDERLNPAYVSDWATDWVQMPWTVKAVDEQYDEEGNLIKEGKREPVLLNTAMPFMDLNRIPDPTNPIGSLRDLFAQTAPQIKNPLEFATNTSSFFNSPIAKEGDNKALAYGDHFMNQFALGNIAKGFFGRDSNADVGLHLLNSTTGVKMNSYDYETSKYMIQDEEENKDGKLVEAIKKLLSRMGVE